MNFGRTNLRRPISLPQFIIENFVERGVSPQKSFPLRFQLYKLNLKRV